MSQHYPIGQLGKPWDAEEKAQWKATAAKQRDYNREVVSRIQALRRNFEVINYGQLNYDNVDYPVFVIKNQNWQADKPIALVTGGVHGYERSGIHGVLDFLEHKANHYLDHFNILVFPCISPWGYETINRWTPIALDPNRSFYPDSPVKESSLVMDYLQSIAGNICVHIDLHETTDTDETTFRPALAARDGKAFEAGTIPDGFYLVADEARIEPAFQQAILDSVATVTHIAPSDEDGLIGSPIIQPGLIAYPMKALGLCGSITDAQYHTTTEVYPDSPLANHEICNQAQVAAITGALDYIIQQ